MRVGYISESYMWDLYGTKRLVFEELRKGGEIDLLKIDRNNSPVFKGPYDLIITMGAMPFSVAAEAVKHAQEIVHVRFYLSDSKENLAEVHNLSATGKVFTHNCDVAEKSEAQLIAPPIPVLHDEPAVSIRQGVIYTGRINHPISGAHRARCLNYLEKKGIAVDRISKETDALDVYALMRKTSAYLIGLDLDTSNLPLSRKCYEIPGSGTLLITRDRWFLNKFFEPDSEVIAYRNRRDLKNKVEYYLSRLDECLAIARRGFERSKDYSADKFVRHILASTNLKGN